MKKRVIIIGGGYGGVRTMQRLSTVQEIEIILIDRNPYHYLQTEAYALIASSATVTDITINLVALCKSYKNVVYKKAAIKSIDLIAKTISSDNEVFSYDYLVIASGSSTQFPASIPGLQKYSHGVKTLKRAFEFKQQFECELYERMQSEEDLLYKAFNVVIGGAGLSGVEIATEMGHYAMKFMHDNRMMGEGIQIYLIASREKVLDGMHPFLQEHAEKRLKRLGVNVLYKTRISEVKEDSVLLSDGQSINFDFMIFAGGVKASSIGKSLGCPLNAKGQIVVDPTLQIVCHKQVYAIGDVADLVDAAGKVIPATANAAEQSAEVVAKNIKAQLKGERPQHAFIGIQGMLVALGGYQAAVVLFNTFKVSGFLGYLLKKMIFWRYRYRLDRHAYRSYKAQLKGDKRVVGSLS